MSTSKKERLSVRRECSGSKASQDIERLIKKLTSEVTSIRENAFESLVALGEPAVLPLIDALQSYRYRSVHSDIVELLGSIGEPAIEHIIGSFKEGDEDFELNLLKSLEAIGEQTIEPLLKLLDTGNAVEKHMAARALGIMKSAEAVDALILSLSDKDVRYAAVIALGKIGDKEAAEPLIEYLNDPSSDEKKVIVEALGKMGMNGSTEAVDALILSLSNEDVNHLGAVVVALGKIGDKKAVEPLIRLLNHPTYKIRARVATALEAIGDERAVGPMIEILYSRGGGWYWSAQGYIISAIASFKSKRTVELLIEAFKSDNTAIKEPAAKTVAKMGNIAIGPLIKALEEGDVETRYYAAKSLGFKKDKRAVKALERLKNDESEDEDVRSAAWRALCEIKGDKSITHYS